uniref:PGG domain-containing protein n=1 Tax=Ananas comosus var. bracteatus TaxID=296719 RepID=A0A6V7PJP7_ANACO|nr:unnamed protein product [Ananas comosus var. bracteatus]
MGAIHGPCRLDKLNNENNNQPDQEEKQKAYERAAKNLTIASVLIATVTFAAAFTMPGGYKADDHPNGGTPTLAGKYAFNAFIISDSLAFVCSIMVTFLLTYVSSFRADPSVRIKLIVRSSIFLSVAINYMMVAFAMSVYVVLAPVSTPVAFLSSYSLSL